MKTIISFVCTLLLSLNCYAETIEVSEVEIDQAYVRATPPHTKNSAAFLTITNPGSKSIKLIAASSDIAERLEIHNHIHEEGMMKMRQVDEVIIDAKSSTTLQPGGYHVMFIGLKQELSEGQTVKFNLYFDNGDEIMVNAPIQKN